MGSHMSVELLHTEGCPHAAAYLPHLQQLLVAAGVDEPVGLRLVTDDDQARQERFLGSPMIRVAGLDGGWSPVPITGLAMASPAGSTPRPTDSVATRPTPGY